MIKARIQLCAAMAAIVMAGCATGTATEEQETPAPNAGATPGLADLPTQVLASGQCALVLWSRAATPSRFVVTLDQPAVARVSVQGRVVELARVAQNGASIHGHFPEQRYRGDGISLDVSFAADQARSLNHGAVVSSALVEYVDGNGWTSIIPAVGLIACQN